MTKVWLGGIYFKEEGGYEIILKALNHYKKRLKTLNDSPELKDSAAMFASVLNQQARKTVPKINETIEKIEKNLDIFQNTNKLQEDIPFFEKALTCYEADIHKAEDTGYEYFIKLVGDMAKARTDLKLIKTALDKINQFSEES
ncbi:hypothetical protein [Nitrosopumilus sp.]|uniref:hypothetical protein n=1 Tax=Nitrosopumilus sp. TaxID=2024843 RepID=UPI00247B7D29|nr:hypothetical protein [Nitrosopumilus sp.]MCV0429956.1 hypothetical protein [Nitrosopumilus sp.]